MLESGWAGDRVVGFDGGEAGQKDAAIRAALDEGVDRVAVRRDRGDLDGSVLVLELRRLERAADVESEAALMLGTTYDPAVVGNQDMRSITPDPAMARQWYQKAAALGSADARRRLSQIQN